MAGEGVTASVNKAADPLPLKDNEGGALNLTRVTGLGAALVVVLTTFNNSWETIFGSNAPTWAKPVVVISVIGAFAIVASADMLARGYAAGQRGDIIPLPDGLPAKLIVGEDEDVSLVAVRYKAYEEGTSEFLIAKSDKSTAWVSRSDLKFNAPQSSDRVPI
jgi:hypothetical protein